MSWYENDAFRENGARTYYTAQHTPWQFDIVVTGLISCFLILAASFYAILIGGIGWKEILFSFTRVTTSLFIGAVILVTNYSMTWESAEISTRTKYKAGTGAEVNVTIGVIIGFRGINITMKGDKDQIEGETINYNEHFSWEGLQGRIGYGRFAGRFNRDYLDAQQRGLPLPILWVAEYFTLDGEGIRWGRFYRQSGWYAHIMLWLAFPLWILSNLLMFVLLRYGGKMLILTGVSMVLANIIWSTHLCNVSALVIPFTEWDALTFRYGASYWICLATGVGCIVMGILIFAMDKLTPSMIAKFFDVDVRQDSEQIQEEDDPPTVVDTREDNSPHVEDPGMQSVNDDDDDQSDENDIYAPPPPLCDSTDSPTRTEMSVRIPTRSTSKSSYRSSVNRKTHRFQRPRRKESTRSDSESSNYANASPTPYSNMEMLPTTAEEPEDDVNQEDDNQIYSNCTC